MICDWCTDPDLDRRHWCLTREIERGNEPADRPDAPDVCACTEQHYH